MTCSHDHTILERYLDDELDAREVTLVEKVLDSCEHCAGHVDALRLIGSELQHESSSLVSKANFDGLWERISNELETDTSNTKSDGKLAANGPRWWSRRRLVWAFGASACAVALVAVLWSNGENPRVPGEPVAKAVDNTLIVESYEYTQGTVVIDTDPDDPAAPAVVWHFVDSDPEEGQI